jgi:hypothetical protein
MFESICLRSTRGCNQFDSVLTENAGTPAERHFVGISELGGTRLDQIATELFREATGKSGRGGRLANRFTDLVRPYGGRSDRVSR